MDSLFKTLKDTSHESIEGTTLNMDDFVDIYNGLALNFSKTLFLNRLSFIRFEI